jgi:5'-phosphate synthase pdxT subunit
MTRIGVLALQGDFREHIRAMQRLGVLAHAVRLPEQLAEVDGLVIPGGESTVMGKLMVEYGLDQPLRGHIAAGTPVWGTCAGLILLARETDNPLAVQPLLAKLSVRVARNAFGGQRESFEVDLRVPVLGAPNYHAVFIRAPAVVHAAPEVEILARLEDDGDHGNGTIVAVRDGSILGTAFHPEVTEDLRFHEYFLDIVRGRSAGAEVTAATH